MQELLRVADRFQAGGLYEHCLAEFGRALTVETAIQQLVWAHAHAPEAWWATGVRFRCVLLTVCVCVRVRICVLLCVHCLD